MVPLENICLKDKVHHSFVVPPQPLVFRDLVAHGQQNVWICEVGSKRLNGSFEAFLQNILDSGKLIFNAALFKTIRKRVKTEKFPARIHLIN